MKRISFVCLCAAALVFCRQERAKPIEAGIEGKTDQNKSAVKPVKEPSEGEGRADKVDTPLAQKKTTLEIPSVGSSFCKPSQENKGKKPVELAHIRFQKGQFEEAIECSRYALEKDWGSVPAMHIEGASNAALGRWAEAKDSFAGALALDPNDPETLAAVSEFYVNMLRPKKKRYTTMGLEYANRGFNFFRIKERGDERLLDRLELLIAEAQNDLGFPHLALEKAKNVSLRRPDWPSAIHELAMSSFGMSEIKSAKEQFDRVLELDPLHAYASHYLAVLKQRAGESNEAKELFAKAASLDPEVFHQPHLIEKSEFEKEVKRALDELPKDHQEQLTWVSVEIADFPSTDDLLSNSPPLSPTILGLFRGEALPVDWSKQKRLSRRATTGEHGKDASKKLKANERTIFFYRYNLCRVSKSRSELNDHVRRTLVHEWGHLNGLTEPDLHRIEADEKGPQHNHE